MSKEELRIGVLGAWGHIGQVLHELAEWDGGRVIATAPVTEEDDTVALRKHRAIPPDAETFATPAQLLEKVRPEVVLISTRLDRIPTTIAQALRAGCHVITEKPLALDLDTLRQLHTQAKTCNRACVAMLNNPMHPCVQAARQAVQRGDLGEIVLANARKSYRWGQRPLWFGQRASYGGTLPWIGIHALDFIHAVTGLHFTAALGMQGNLARRERPECEDHCAAVVELSNGGHATLSIDFLRPRQAPTHGDDWFRIMGSRGALEASLERQTCQLITEDAGPVDLPLPAPGRYYVPVLESLRGDGAWARAQTRRSFLLTQAALAARDAADRRQLVRIEALD